MKVTLASLLCLVALTMGAAVPSVNQEVRGAAVMENQPSNVMAIEPSEYVQQPFEQNDDALETSATHHKRYYYPGAYYYPHYYLTIILNITTPDTTHTTTRGQFRPMHIATGLHPS